MDIKTFLGNISIFIKHFFNMAPGALLLLKNLSRTVWLYLCCATERRGSNYVGYVGASLQPDMLKFLLTGPKHYVRGS